MINPKIFGILFIVVAAASLGLVTIGFQSTMASVSLADLEEAVEAGNATTTMMTNQTADENGTFLSIQAAQSGSLSELNATAYILELNDITDKTILFSDRPDRFVTSLPTSNFVGNWTTGPNSFQSGPPNAALVLDEPSEQDVTIIELFSPQYDEDNKTSRYDVIPIGNRSSIDALSEFQQSTLVIDVSGEVPICNGACWK